jgi:beta-lactamase regulating signal transducer with metallopeptidase domain
MNALIESLNLFGKRFVDFALPMLLQSSLLIVVIFTLDFVLRKKVRAVVRYGLWMLVMIKLILPPTFASPTGVGYWLPAKRDDKPAVLPVPTQVIVRYLETESVHSLVQSFTPLPPSTPPLAWPAILLLGWASVALGLVTWLVLRARFVGRMSARARDVSPSLLVLLQSCCRQLKIKQPIRLKFSTEATSPAVCGLWRPTILIPSQLADRLSPLPMRAVLLHELAHIKRGDLWVNYAQALLQIFYWYNPLLWLANAVICRVREMAVDEMVMVEMGQKADAYPTTLLEVAKLTFTRSVMSLGLVGIMESKTALRQRIDRLKDLRPPRKAGLTFTAALCVLAVGALAVPMSKAPQPLPVAMNLIRREYRVDRLTFARNLLQRGGISEIRLSSGGIVPSRNRNSYSGPLVSGHTDFLEYRKSIQGAIRRVLAEAGVETKPTEIDMWLFHMGLVEVVTTSEKLPAIERVLSDLNGAPLKDGARLLSPVPMPGDLPLFSRLLRSETQTANAENAKEVSQNNVDKTTVVETNALAAGQTNRLSTVNPQKVEATTLVEDGRVLYELGKLDEAEAKLNQALKDDPGNFGATYYLNLIREIRYGKLARERKQAVMPNPYARTNLIHNSKGRQAILSKLDRIQFDEIHFDGLPLSEVVRTLVIESKKLDPDKRGVSFIINPVDISSVAIKINPALTDVKLADVVDAIVKVADKPIQYSVEDFAVVFSPKTAEASPLYTRFFKVDTNMLVQALQRRSGQSANTNLYLGIRDYLMEAGAHLDPPKNLFYKDRQGMLMVRGTLQDLDIVESVVQTLNVAPPTSGAGADTSKESPKTPVETPEHVKDKVPVSADLPLLGKFFRSESAIQQSATNTPAGQGKVPVLGDLPLPQVQIEVRFAEVSQNDNRALGVDWFLGNLLWNHATDLRGKILPPSGVPAAGDDLLTNGLRNAATAAGQFAGIATDPQFRVVLRALEQRRGVDLLAAPKIRSLSGRRAEIQTVDMRTVIKGFKPEALNPPGVQSPNGVKADPFLSDALPFGPIVEITPNVAVDGMTIRLDVNATVTEFLGKKSSRKKRRGHECGSMERNKKLCCHCR